MSEQTKFTLGNVSTVRGGKRLPHGFSLEDVDNGAPYLRITDVFRGRFSTTGLMFVPQDAQERLTRYRVSEDDIFLSIVGTIGVVARVPKEMAGAYLTENAARLTADRETLDPRYLEYFLLSPDGRRQISNQVVGSTQPKLALSRIKAIEVELPPLEEQRAIAEVLGALDDKIAANTCLTNVSWDVMETEFRRLQKSDGVRTVLLGDIAAFDYGKSLPASKREPGAVAVVGSGGVVGVHSAHTVPQSGVVVGRKGSAGAVHWIAGPHFPIDTTFSVRETAEGVVQPYLYFLLRTLRLNEMNNDSAVPGLNRAAALSSEIKIPTKANLGSFAISAEALINMVEALEAENRTLAETRDALLPKLMSGQLRVRDAERIASDAGA